MELPRSNTNFSHQSQQSEHSQASHYLQRAIKVMKQLTQAQKSFKGLQNQIKVKKLNDINRNLQLAGRKDPQAMTILLQAKILIYIKQFFSENITKAPALTFLKLLIPVQLNSELFLTHNIPILVAKILEKQQTVKQRSNQWQSEMIQAIKLIGTWLEHMPQGFPRILATSLVCIGQLPAFTQFQQRKKDHIPLKIKLLAIDTILLMTTKRLKLSLQAGAFTLLSSAIIDPLMQERSEDIVLRFLYFLNAKQSRDMIWNYLNPKKLYSLFTDMDIVFIEETNRNKGNIQFSSKLQTQLSLAKQALLTLLKSWTGLILLGNDGKLLSSIMEALKQIPLKVESQVRRSIYSLIQQVLAVGQGIMGDNHPQNQNNFRASTLLNAYMITLLRLLLDNRLFEVLVELSGINEPSVAEPAQRLLKKLSIYIFNFLPDAAGYLDFLISAGTQKGNSSSLLKYSSSFIVNKIGGYIFEENKDYKNAFFGQLQHVFSMNNYVSLNRSTVLSISKTLNFLTYKQVPFYRRKLLDQKPIPKEHKENFKKWDWNCIIDLLSFPDPQKEGTKSDSNDRYKQYKLFKYLLRFYSPSRGNFVQQKWAMENLIYVKAGKLLISNTLMIPDNLALVRNPPQSQFQCTISFIGELQKLLEMALQKAIKSNTRCYMPFFKTLQRQLLLWIGSFSQTKVGYETLICENHFFQILTSYIPKKQCALIISTILLNFDFYRQNLVKKYQENEVVKKVGPKILLSNCVDQGSKPLKLNSIQIIKLLYRSQISGFMQEGFKMLFSLSTCQDQQIWQNAIQAIQYLICDKQLLEGFLLTLMQWQLINQQKIAIFLKRMTPTIIIRLLGLEEGYRFIVRHMGGWLEEQYKIWMSPRASQVYFQNMQKLLSDCLNFSKKEEKGYRMQTKDKDMIQWGFLYKLPWIAYINQNQEVPLRIKQNNQSLFLDVQFIDQQYEFRHSNNDNILRLCLGVGNVFLDQRLSPTSSKLFVPINLNYNQQVTLYGQKYYSSNNNGVTVYFTLKPRAQNLLQNSQSETYANSYDIKRIHIEVNRNAFYQNEQLPVHLIQQLTKTQNGMAFLQKQQMTKYARWVLSNVSTNNMQQIRSVLWSLGYYGSTKSGIKKLIEEKIVDQIIDLSLNCQTLSLRGTCRYVLNMFCHSQQGRGYLSLQGLRINNKNLSCFPQNPQKLYKILDPLRSAQQSKIRLFKQYTSNLKQITAIQTVLFDSISLLINSLSNKQAHIMIKQHLRNHPKIGWSFALLNNVVQMMSYFKLKNQSRKTIQFVFDDFVRSFDFTQNIQGKITYSIE